jgi:ArsR family transcriptional regulator, arsenate/arsenite/antimonite-responsive transcriptional repressor
MFDFMNITRALSDENRVRIIAALEDRELCVCQIIDLLQLSPSTVSKHLSILRNARLLDGRKEGRWMHYSHSHDPQYPVATEAIEWVLRCIGTNERIRCDRERLMSILADQGAQRCA